MKRFFYLVAFLTFAFDPGFGQTNEVFSRNAVGFVKVTIPPGGGYALVAVNFNSFDGSNLSLLDIFGTNQLTKANVYARADKVYVWNYDLDDYKRYAQKTSGDFYEQADWVTGAATNPVIVKGSGIWLQSPHSATNERAIFIAGQVVSNSVSSNAVVPGYQCIGSPFSAELVMTNNNWLADGASGNNDKDQADQIITWNGADFERYGLAADGRWYNWTNWVGDAVDRIITLGEGAWYVSKTNVTWTWTQPKPYSWP